MVSRGSSFDDILIKSPQLTRYVSDLKKTSAEIEKLDEDITLRRLDEVLHKNIHLRRYLEDYRKRTGVVPRFYETLSLDMGDMEDTNILYPVGDPIFIHVSASRAKKGDYITIQPTLTPEEEMKYKEVLDIILLRAAEEPPHTSEEDFMKAIERLLKDIMVLSQVKSPFSKKKTVPVTQEQYENIAYRIKRDLVQSGILEPMLRDSYLEDIHSIGLENVYVYHKIFGMLQTNVKFREELELDSYLKRMSERIGKLVTDVEPIIDASLPDGSRINIIYSDDISKSGPSFTIRKFPEKPLTLTQLAKWGTFNAEILAYLWLCLEFGMNICLSGETSSGKTTTLNALLTFARPNAKIYSTEDTPEVVIPHKVWQRLVTRETGPQEARVELFDLIKAAMRSRPDIIVVGEVRGKEGFAAFQAMQTGHQVLYTFHASSILKMIQRFTGDPINVPVRFFDNLNVAIFQQIIYERGRIKRRISSIDEVLGYSKEKGGVMTRTIFTWDPVMDKHHFRGVHNSYILESKIAPKLGYEDARKIYDDLTFRARILDNMIDDNILGYEEVIRVFRTYHEEGFEGLSDRLKRERTS